MSRLTCLAAVLGIALAGCAPEPEPPAPQIEPVLTPDEAKAALLAMMHTPAAKKLGWFDGDVVDDMAKMSVEAGDDGWYTWTGAFQFHPAKATYLFTVRPRPGSRACTFEYTGTFAHRDGRWVATTPELVRTVLQAGE
jgi:hypothetical protein